MATAASIGAVVEQITRIDTEVKSRLGTQEEQIKKTGESSEALGKELKALGEKHAQEHEELRGQLEEYKKKLTEWETKAQRPGGLIVPEGPAFKTVGQVLGESSQLKDWMEGGKSGQSKMVQLKSLNNFAQYRLGSAAWEAAEIKSLVGNTELRNVLSVERLQQIMANPLRADRVRDLYPTITTNAALIEYIREINYQINADTQVEGEAKPESNFTFVDAQSAMKVIAHWIPLPKQILDDINGLRAYLDMRLIEGLKLVEDRQLLYGDGIGPNIQGILTDPEIQKYLWSSGTLGDTKLDCIRKAMTLCQLAQFPVTGIVLNPIDWQDIELVKSNDGLYVWVNVGTGADQQIWRVPVVVTTAINPGTFLLGAFRMGAAIWDKEEANIRMSDSHANFFIENRVAVLCEERLTQTIFRPQSFVKGTFDTKPLNPPS